MTGHRPSTTTAAPRRRSTLVAVLAALALALTSLSATAPATGETTARVLVTAAQGVDDAVAAIVEAGGTIVNRFDTFGIVVADVPDAGVLSTDARVATVERDSILEPQNNGRAWGRDDEDRKDRGRWARDGDGDAAGPRGPTWSVSSTINADSTELDGSGVTVVVLDTGVTGTPPLADALTHAVDTSGEGHPEDGYGHGTFMAGLVAGDDTEAGWRGVAPGAELVSVKVADKNGKASISSVIAGLAVAKAAHEDDEIGADILLLAAGGDPTDQPDALRLALRQLWASGLVVVVPSGNVAGEVSSPGNDEYLLTAGAFDDAGTDGDPSDDGPADFSGSGEGKPDVTAPGVSLVSTRSPDSKVVRQNQGSKIGDWLFRGSGTSMAAAVTAGAAALLLQQQPGLTPDEVKTKLTLGATDGRLDVAGALATDVTDANNVNGALPAIELLPDPEVPEEGPELPPGLQRGAPVQGWHWDGNSWIGNSWVGARWEGNSWVGNSWVGNSWVGNSWIGNSWVGNSWIGNSWVGNSWVGNSWVGNSWVGNSWVGNSWVGNSWVGNSWVGNSWVGNSWVGNSWVGNSWVSDNWVGHSWS